jgi:hypothetical protein
MSDPVSFEQWRQAAAERILGDESLRSALTDQESQALTAWGLARMDDCLRQAQAAGFPMRLDELPPCIEQVRQAMRGVNVFIRQKDNLSVAEATERLQELLANAPGVQVSGHARARLAADLAGRKDHLTAVDLVAVLSGADPRAAAEAPVPARIETLPSRPSGPLAALRHWFDRLAGR